MLPKGFSTFLKNPDMPKLVCVVVAVFLAVLILRYFKVIEGMANGMMSDLGVGGGKGGFEVSFVEAEMTLPSSSN